MVLKAEEARYNSSTLPWVKLKRDYIPGIYDCIDMAVIGASWDKERARELGVGTDTFTTFYVAALASPPEDHEKPNFVCLFSVSYGLSKEQLERLNFDIKAKSPIPHNPKGIASLSYTFSLCPGLSPPTVMLRDPMLFELFGAGFDKPQGSKYYAIRWPRVSKVYRKEERSWTSGETLETYSAKAYAAVGRDPSDKSSTIQVAKMWDVSPGVSPLARSIVKTKAIEFDCLHRLRRKEPVLPYVASGRREKREPPSRHQPVEETIGLRTDALVSGGFPDPLELLARTGMSEDEESPRKRRKAEPQTPETTNTRAEEEAQWSITRSLPQGLVFPSVLPQAASSPLGSPLYTPSSSPVQVSPGTRDVVTMDTLLTESFILVYRPLYPPPVRPPNRPALRLILPAGRLVSTLEALLVGVAWVPRRMPVSHVIRRGVIFVEPDDASRVIQELESRLPVEHEQLARIFVVSKHYLETHGQLDTSTIVDVLWKSH